MLKYGVQDVIHIENDVLLYYNVDEELVEKVLEGARKGKVNLNKYSSSTRR
jgi:hypothetical protein